MSGKPEQLYPDTAAKFKSEALRRGCEQHGIALDYRPPGEPHYGGIVKAAERLRHVRADRWIGYSSTAAPEWLETPYGRPDRPRMPNLLLIGPTNNGSG